MTECRIININDGRPLELSNGNFLFSQRYSRMEEELEKYLDQGFQVKQMVPYYTPGEPGGQGYAFYRSGMVFYLEREVPEGGSREPREEPEELALPPEAFDEDAFDEDDSWDDEDDE